MTTSTKHRRNTNSFVMHQETSDGGDIYVVDLPEGYGFMVCDAYGRTRHFPEKTYISQWEAMKAATAWSLQNPAP